MTYEPIDKPACIDCGQAFLWDVTKLEQPKCGPLCYSCLRKRYEAAKGPASELDAGKTGSSKPGNIYPGPAATAIAEMLDEEVRDTLIVVNDEGNRRELNDDEFLFCDSCLPDLTAGTAREFIKEVGDGGQPVTREVVRFLADVCQGFDERLSVTISFGGVEECLGIDRINLAAREQGINV